MGHTDDAVRQSDALVLFGIIGALARKKIFPALYALAKRGRAHRSGRRLAQSHSGGGGMMALKPAPNKSTAFKVRR